MQVTPPDHPLSPLSYLLSSREHLLAQGDCRDGRRFGAQDSLAQADGSVARGAGRLYLVIVEAAFGADDDAHGARLSYPAGELCERLRAAVLRAQESEGG